MWLSLRVTLKAQTKDGRKKVVYDAERRVWWRPNGQEMLAPEDDLKPIRLVVITGAVLGHMTMST